MKIEVMNNKINRQPEITNLDITRDKKKATKGKTHIKTNE